MKYKIKNGPDNIELKIPVPEDWEETAELIDSLDVELFKSKIDRLVLLVILNLI